MTKKKDHLFPIRDLANSVLRGTEAKAVCGRTKVFTRKDFEDTSYHAACGKCIAGAADIQGDPISFRTKKDWLGILESAFLDATADQVAYSYYTTTPAASPYRLISHITAPTGTNPFPPAA